MELLSPFRGEFTQPLTKVVMGLRSAVNTEGAQVVVAQRLKRQPRIISKLARFPRMDLSRMQDIGGCRAILPDVATTARVQRRIERQKSRVVSVDDYNAEPKAGGYRAVHLIVERDATRIEVQLRTIWQQEWATLVEDLDGSYELSLKDEAGPDELLAYLQLLASAQEAEYAGPGLDERLAGELRAARQIAEDWLNVRGVAS